MKKALRGLGWVGEKRERERDREKKKSGPALSG